MKLCVYLLLLALAACSTKPNPGVCCTTDADCTRLGGIQPRGCPDGYACRDLLCAAADCAAAADCSAEQPVCDLDSASCTGCTASSDCDGYADAPVCDTAIGGCRACALDSECASEVCDIDIGRCVAESEIIYASPGGADMAGCTHQQPCSVARAIAVASADPSSSLVRLLPGTYLSPVVFSSGVVEVVGTGAAIMFANNAVEARESAVVEVRGFDIHGYVACTGSTSLFPSLTIRDSTMRFGWTALVTHGILRIFRSSVGPVTTAVAIFGDSTFEADQTRFEGVDPGGVVAYTNGSRNRVRITNSIFERASLSMSGTVDALSKNEYYASSNTFIFDNQAHVQSCSTSESYPPIALFENNIFFASSPQVQSVISGFDCTLAGNITHPQDPDLGGTNIDQDPKFVDLPSKDYRLQPGSPAVDAAVPSSGPGLDHDFVGTPRPQGTRKDIGAFELRP